MTIGVFLVLLVVVIGVGLFAEPVLMRRRSGHSLTARLRHLSRYTQQALNAVITPSHKKLVPDFKNWIAVNIPKDDPLREWLLSLPEEAIEALTRQLAAFCQDLNLELEWLVNNKLDLETRQQLEQIVISYCRSCLKAVEIQPQIVTFRNYARFMDRLGNQKQVTYQLLDTLNQKGLVDAPPPDLLTGSVNERLAYVRQVIRTAAQRDRATVKSVLDEYWQ